MAAQDKKARYSSIEQVNLATLRSRGVPDVPEDVDFVMEHLNDPNFDVSYRSPSLSPVDKSGNQKPYPHDTDTESQLSDRYSTSRAESRNSTAIDFDEYAFHFLNFCPPVNKIP